MPAACTTARPVCSTPCVPRPFFVEIFTTRTRFTSAAVSYNVAYALFGGTAPFIGTALVAQSGIPAAPGYYMAAAAVIVLALLTLTKVPETHQRVH